MSSPSISKGFTWADGATVMPSRLNQTVDDATLQCTQTDVLVGRATSGAGEAEEIPCPAVARTLLAKTTLADQRTLVGGVQIAVVSVQFDKTDTTLADVTGLSASVVAGGTYLFEVRGNVTQATTGKAKIALGGTCTVSAFSATSIYTAGNSAGLNFSGSTPSAKGTALNIGNDSTTGNAFWVSGTITVANAGTLTVQFAQQSATGTSSVLVGSSLKVFG